MKTECPYGICDGSGEYEFGKDDDIEMKKCLCKKDNEDERDTD